MNSNTMFSIKLLLSFLPFAVFAFLNCKSNVRKENRNRQYPMPFFAVTYSIALLIFMNKLSALCVDLFMKLADLLESSENLSAYGDLIRNIQKEWGFFLELVLFNTIALVLYVIIKRIMTLIFGRIKVRKDTFVGSVVELFYTYDELSSSWFIREHYGQACTFIKTAYFGSCFVSGLAMLISSALCTKHLISTPFYPAFAVIIIGELAFFVDGLSLEERKSDLSVQTDKSRHIAMYPLLIKPLKALFGDKLSADGTTVNTGGVNGGSIEEILVGLERDCGHTGKNYAAFIRKKMDAGLKPNIDYVRCGYDLANGKSLLFNTPFYDKLNPYVFYAMNRELLKGGKILVVLGRHGTEDDLKQWIGNGIYSLYNVPELWNIAVLDSKKLNEDELPDIGLISRSGVHDLDIHKNNMLFLRKVSFVIVVEPSKLVTTAQVGLNLLIKCCGTENNITFCSMDRNCDGLVDSLSHILMTNITEVSATEYPHGMSSYMYWTADDDYLQHRILPGVSRFLGIGTELSMVALKNQAKETVWYGGDAFPVLDARWIAKQYYHDLLNYAQLPTNQETFDKCFRAYFNICDERVCDYSFISVEDDRNNLFETRRNFATIAEKQGFVNVISAEYMLREYMAANTEIFTADAKAIPYITADYARTKRNTILSICLLLCIDCVSKETLVRQLTMLNIDTSDPVSEIWKEVCIIFSTENNTDNDGNPVLSVRGNDGETVHFERDSTILFKRVYSVESGKFESVYTIEDSVFSRIILDDLQNASYIAEQESKDVYIGTELKGHVYQKYLPGQFFTLNGKYYEMISTTSDNRILVRRASEHIDSRLFYRQVRNYKLHNLMDSSSMGTLKTVNNINIHYQFADFSIETQGYWKLRANNDFDNGALVKVNGVPEREYYHKHILKFDFSEFGDAFTDSVRMTLTNLINEAFVTLFADNQPFISAVTPGDYNAPLTYSLSLDEGLEHAEKCIFIIEDSQLDIGLLVAVERNVNRILQIITDYLIWNDEEITKSINKKNVPEETEEKESNTFNVFDTTSVNETEKSTLSDKFRNLFRKKKDNEATDSDSDAEENLTPRQRRKAERAAAKAAKKAEKEQQKNKIEESTDLIDPAVESSEETIPENEFSPKENIVTEVSEEQSVEPAETDFPVENPVEEEVSADE